MRTALVSALLVGCGGFAGALLRYGLSGWVHRQLPFALFPYGTLAVNLVGCVLIGLIAALVETRQLFGPEFRSFALVGILGSFTTFSTFGYETFAMAREGEYLRAGANVAAQVALGLAAVWAGYGLAAAR